MPGVRDQGSVAIGQVSPVKFAALVFFEEFNGASRDQVSGLSFFSIDLRNPLSILPISAVIPSILFI